ncbi:hypothetical protein MMC07_003833 [Pseudocyphellaria aurata]|nr:hypothetical protein [Pseudocyphellaria aurata]
MAAPFFSSRRQNALPWSLSTRELLRPRRRLPIRHVSLTHESTLQNETVSFRKQLKDEAKQRRAAEEKASRDTGKNKARQLDRWELTVGIEIHAQLNTDRKLFSSECNVELDRSYNIDAIEGAATSINEEANSNVSVFDLALPGTQPIFQTGTVVPALRAALAFNCRVMSKSKFDRKHYFYPDQPAGYQITQFYEPFARGGSIIIYDHEGIAPEDGKFITVGIKQIQLEQDTAKTVHQPPSTSLLDFNRVSHPLIEIITLPQIHHPQTAAACVRKIQSVLQAVSAVTTGMEIGGLRADVNVSVRSRTGINKAVNSYAYEGITGLGQRTEIKNLSSFKAVEGAIIAERDRQIEVLEAGGKVEGETRGWTLGSTETKKLRAKEGEVDYRYMPDPDVAPLVIDPKLVDHISETLPMLPDESINNLVTVMGLTLKDAKTLVILDDGARLDYFDDILFEMKKDETVQEERHYAKTVANWVLHELGGLLRGSEQPFSENKVSAAAMASIVKHLIRGRITGSTAQQLLSMAFDGESRDIDTVIEDQNMWLEVLSREVYLTLAQDLVREHEKMVQQITVKKQHGKINWLLGQMMRKGEGKLEASKAEAVLREVLGVGEREK